MIGKLNHVAIFDNVVFAFNAQFARLFGLHMRPQFHQIVVSNHFRCNEAAFEVGVNHAGSLRCFHAFGDGPGTGFFLPGGQVSAET